MEKKFDVTGMTCSACQRNVEKDVSKLKGVNKVEVSLLTNSMVVDFDDDVVSIQDIYQSVEEGGYKAQVKGETKQETVDPQIKEIAHMRKRVIVSFAFFIPLLYIAMGPMIGLPNPGFLVGMENSVSFAFTQMLLIIPIVYMNLSYFTIGFKQLWKRTPNMDSLIAIGSFAAIVYGIYAIYQIGIGLGTNQMDLVNNYHMNLYFESAAAILTLVTLGKYLEAKSKGRTSDALKKLMKLAPSTALKIVDGKVLEVGIEEIKVDDLLLVKPGMKIPVDGMIVDGNSAIDESMISGEAIPVDKTVGDHVISATMNKTGAFQMKATHVGADTTLSKIITLVENAASSKAPIQKLVDKISGVFVPIVILLSIISFSVWLISGATFSFALSIGITVLVISCPCALGLATPVAIMVGTGKGAENGTLFKSAESLEVSNRITTIVLDKTGTITMGEPKITEYISLSNLSDEEILRVAYSLEINSEHPIGEAIVNEAMNKKLTPYQINEFNSLTGYGIQAKIEDTTYYVGNQKLVKQFHQNDESYFETYEELAKMGKTVVTLFTENEILGYIALKDPIKESSKHAIQRMKSKGYEVIMLTGDQMTTALSYQNELQLDQVYAEVLPHQKEEVIQSLQKQGKRVAMVGDGINDSVALVRADLGMAIGAGSDIAIESADVVLMKSDLNDAIFALGLSKQTVKIIRMNLFWAFFYNVILIPIAMGLFFSSFGWRLNPTLGSMAMSISSVTVVLNALRLRLFKLK